MTPNNPFAQLARIGQSFWLDNLSRDLLQSGGLQRLVNAGEIKGITTNPSIFKAAIASGAAYREDLARYRHEETNPERRYERLAIADVQAACDILQPVYQASAGDDGYVSLEVSPHLADDAEGTLMAARRLHAEVGRENVLIKIPGTPAGAEAFEDCIAEGLSVNVTLLFSLQQMQRIFNAYVDGLQRHRDQGGNITRTKAVASFFMSRIDSLVDKQLAALQNSQALTLRGRTAVAVGKIAYTHYVETFGGATFNELRLAGARPQYLLWASTSTKNPEYHDLLYVEPLIGPHTVNTLPDATLNAFRDHGRVADTVGIDLHNARATLASLQDLGIDHEAVGQQLQREGLTLFEQAYDELIHAVS